MTDEATPGAGEILSQGQAAVPVTPEAVIRAALRARDTTFTLAQLLGEGISTLSFNDLRATLDIASDVGRALRGSLHEVSAEICRVRRAHPDDVLDALDSADCELALGAQLCEAAAHLMILALNHLPATGELVRPTGFVPPQGVAQRLVDQFGVPPA